MPIPLTQAIQETLMRDFASGVWTQTTRQFMAQIGQPETLPTRFLGPLLLPAGVTLRYTATQSLQIVSMRLAYGAGAAVFVGLQVAVYLVPSGGSPNAGNRRVQINMNPGDHYLCPEVVGEFMDVGDMVYTEVTTGGVISMIASGRSAPLR